MSKRLRFMVSRAVPAFVAVMLVAAPVAPAFAFEVESARQVISGVAPAPLPESIPDAPVSVVPVDVPEEEPQPAPPPGNPEGPTASPAEPGPVAKDVSEKQEAQSSGGGGSPPAPLSGPPDPPYSATQPVPNAYQVRPDVDQSTGALTYRYPLTLSPGRGGMAPDISLVYNSQDQRNGSVVGYGWNLSLPSIDQSYATGVFGELHSDEYFTSSLSGELVRVVPGSGSGNFMARVDDGSFVRYTFASSSQSSLWVVGTKDGTNYFFGSATSSRVYDAVNDPAAVKVARWLIDRIEDRNGNRINFYYTRDANQLYLDHVTYTDTALGDGIFRVNFIRELRPFEDRYSSYSQGFRMGTDYRISEIQAFVNGALSHTYTLGYIQSPANNRSLLERITETGYGSAGQPTILPPTIFSYTENSIGFADGPNPLSGISLRSGYMISDINGDAYADLVRSYKYQTTVPPVTSIERHVYLNNHLGGLVEDVNWTATSSLQFICTDNPSISLDCIPEGVGIFDTNGDLLPDYIESDPKTRLNTGNGWEVNATGPIVPSLHATYTYRPHVDEFDGGGVANVMQVNIGGSYGTPGVAGNRTTDWNGDGLADAVRSIGNPNDVYGLDERLEVNVGIPFGAFGSNEEFTFINSTNVGANALSVNAVFERDTHKDALMGDVNGDGLPDVIANDYVYRHNGKSWATTTPIQYQKPHHETQLADWNGDGFADLTLTECDHPTAGPCTSRILYNTITEAPDLLKTITLPTGGTIGASYRASNNYFDGSGVALNPSLPLFVRTVEKITESDPVESAIATTTYAYAGGKYFFENILNRRFAGFEEVTKARPDGSKAVTRFNVTEDGKIGKPVQVDILDSAGVTMSRSLTDWEATAIPATGGARFFTAPVKTVAIDFGPGASHRDRAEEFSYAAATGALLERIEYGEVSAAIAAPISFTDVGTDRRTTDFTYAQTGNGLEFLASQTVLDYSGQTVSQARTYYDSLPLGQVLLGNQTKQEELIGAFALTYAGKEFTYTPEGLIATETDPLQHATQFTYDVEKLYPVTVTNAMSQAATYTYDYATGNVLTATGPNGELTRKVYDGVGRLIEEWRPDPTLGFPTKTKAVSYADTPTETAVHETVFFTPEGAPSANTYAIEFEGDLGEYASAPDSASLSVTGDFTIEAWAKFESLPANGTNATIAAKWSSAPGNRSYFFSYFNDSGTLKLNFSVSSDGTNAIEAMVPYSLPIDAWRHLAATYTASSGRVEFFVDGVSVGTATGLPTSSYDGVNAFLVGAREVGGIARFDGRMDEVRLWGVVRTASDIATYRMRELSGTEPNLRAYWNLNNVFGDATPNGNALSGNSASFVTDVPFAGAAVSTPDSYLYFDGFGRAIEQRSRTDGSGPGGAPAYTVVATSYDGNGRISGISLPYRSYGISRTGDALGELETLYGYDGKDRVVRVEDAVGESTSIYAGWDETVTNPKGVPKEFGRDAFGRLVRVGEFLSATSSPFVTSYGWNANENLAKITDAAGNVRNFTYDARGLRKSAEDLHAVGDATFGTYLFTYDGAGNMTQKQTPKDQVIVYSYDALNRKTSEDFLGAAGVEVSYTYDTCTRGIGRQCGESKTGFAKSLAYDYAGNVESESATIAGVPYSTSYGYDEVGHVTKITHPGGSKTLYALGVTGKPGSVSWQSAGSGIATPVVSSIAYAPHGAVSKMVHGNGLEEYLVYGSGAKYRLEESFVAPPGSSSATSNTQAIQLVRVANQYLYASDTPALSVTGNLTLEAWVKLASSLPLGDGMVVASKWDAVVNDRSYLFRIGGAAGGSSFEFGVSTDGANQMFAVLPHNLGVGAWHHVAAAYTASSGSVEFFVDGASIGTQGGLPTAIHNGAASFAIGARDVGHTPLERFDGVVDEVRLWSEARSELQIREHQLSMFGSAPNLMGSWHLNSSFSDASGMGGTLVAQGSPAFAADVPFAEGESVFAPSSSFISSRSYGYDSIGNILSVAEVSGTGTTTSSYSYDGLDRLLEAAASTETVTGTTQTVSQYAYDSIGNILTMTKDGVPTAYAYAGNQGTSYANPHAATQVGNLTFSYNKNGDVISGSDRVTHTWDWSGRLTKVTLPSRDTVTFKYDPSGTRVSVKPSQSSVTTYYASRGFNVSGATTTISFDAAGTPVGTVEEVGTSTPKLYASHTDHLRSTKLATDEVGTVVEATAYDAFGKITAHEQAGTFAEQRKFTGHEYDASSNYTYAKARYLDTSFGRFLSQDPAFVALGDRQMIGEKTGRELEQILVDPQAMNSYAYARNNPIKFVDPTGEWFETAFDVAMVGLSYQDFKQNPGIGTGLGLLADLASVALPIPAFVGGIRHADEIGKFAKKAADKVADGVKAGVKGVDDVSLDALSRAAGDMDRGGLTKAGRALQKHGDRAGSAFSKAKGSPGQINLQGQDIVDDILTDPGSTRRIEPTRRFGNTIEIRDVNGRGLRYSETGEFIGFLEP